MLSLNMPCSLQLVQGATDSSPRDSVRLGEFCLAGETSACGQFARPDAVQQVRHDLFVRSYL
ncbi:hypothetical protein ACS04_15035 [Streptomyces roseus]|uniref:Uncharacterized protein n=1 Tax=Streptomyces roseus TaxID=66430 RepID=A0A0J6XP60_9ACTN|nr:hypothetical protein ACS04_15035 [Streptomyces roseus]